jgi:hypothetical protein
MATVSNMHSSAQDLERREVSDANGRTISFWVSDIQIGKPMLAEKEVFSSDRYIYPAEVWAGMRTLFASGVT